MSRRIATAAIMGCAALWAATATAAPPTVPTTFTQQGRLLNTDGTPATGAVSMVFSIYDSSTATTPIWTETQSVTLDDGYFSVQLGSVTALSSSSALGNNLAHGTGLFLGLTVGTDSEMTPRETLATVPYAVIAQNAIGDITPNSVTVNGITIITPSGTLAVGSAGATGPTGPSGPTGPTGSAAAFSSNFATFVTVSTAANTFTTITSKVYNNGPTAGFIHAVASGYCYIFSGPANANATFVQIGIANAAASLGPGGTNAATWMTLQAQNPDYFVPFTAQNIIPAPANTATTVFVNETSPNGIPGAGANPNCSSFLTLAFSPTLLP